MHARAALPPRLGPGHLLHEHVAAAEGRRQRQHQPHRHVRGNQASAADRTTWDKFGTFTRQNNGRICLNVWECFHKYDVHTKEIGIKNITALAVEKCKNGRLRDPFSGHRGVTLCLFKIPVHKFS